MAPAAGAAMRTFCPLAGICAVPSSTESAALPCCGVACASPVCTGDFVPPGCGIACCVAASASRGINS